MIEVSHVSRNFGTFRAVNDVSFSIPKGQIVGLLGPNGAGKTTTMRMITGFLSQSEGEIMIDGKSVTEFPVDVKRKIGYMPESAPLYGDMIVEDYLKYVAEIDNQNIESKISELCEQCGLKEIMSKKISELSRGNRQRVALAHALMGDPEILILDEPTSGLDPNQVEDVRNIIRELGKTRTVIISTHILSEVETLCSRVIIISGGNLVADSSITELKEQFNHNVSIKITAKGDFEKVFKVLKSVSRIDTVTQIEASEILSDDKCCGALITVVDNSEIRPEIVKVLTENKIDLFEMNIKKNSLEEVFHSLTNEKVEEK